jgi:hypothetical protein
MGFPGVFREKFVYFHLLLSELALFPDRPPFYPFASRMSIIQFTPNPPPLIVKGMTMTSKPWRRPEVTGT